MRIMAMFALSIHVAAAQCAAPDESLTETDQAVWTSIVSGLCSKDFPTTNVVVIRANVGLVSASGPENSMDPMPDLLHRNNGRDVLPPKQLGCPGLRIASASEVQELFSRAEHNPPTWDAFYKRFPGAKAITFLSYPGYSSNGTNAVVETSYDCGATCGAGHIYSLELKSGRWVVIKRETTWIS